jgi:hypothetical protein
MNRRARGGVAAGVVLVLLGVWFLIVQFVPWLEGWFSWPMIIIGVGALLLVFGLLGGEPGMAVPAFVVGGIGCLLFWQNATGNWESWSYAWALIPCFVGVGTLFSGILGRDGEQIRGGAWLLLIGAILFAVFGSFFGALGFLGKYWPALLILLGVLSLFQGLFRRRE